jgi:broad specificity phosphatase PhoE
MASPASSGRVALAVAVAVAVASLALVRWRRGPAEARAALEARLRERYHAAAERRAAAPARVARAVPTPLLRPDSTALERLGLEQGASWAQVLELLARMRSEGDASARVVQLIRHGEGSHNVAERELGSRYWETVEALTDKYFDAPLNEVGRAQCAALNAHVLAARARGLPDPDAIIVSPLTRALETAKLSLAHLWGKVPVYAVEMSRERMGKNQCDRRKSVSQLRREFPEVDFDLFMEGEQDEWFTPARETDEAIQRRVRLFYGWLKHAPWSHVAVVGHSSYMAATLKDLGFKDHWPANCECISVLVSHEAPAP